MLLHKHVIPFILIFLDFSFFLIFFDLFSPVVDKCDVPRTPRYYHRMKEELCLRLRHNQHRINCCRATVAKFLLLRRLPALDDIHVLLAKLSRIDHSHPRTALDDQLECDPELLNLDVLRHLRDFDFDFNDEGRLLTVRDNIDYNILFKAKHRDEFHDHGIN